MSAEVLAIDPGTTESAWISLFNDGTPKQFGFVTNHELLDIIMVKSNYVDVVAIEMIASYGMAVGRETFETCLWVGRFIQKIKEQSKVPVCLVYRNEVKNHLCHSSRAKDSNVWQAILDRYHGKEKAVGTIKAKGPLYGIHSHVRAALAVGLYAQDTILNDRSTSVSQ